MTDEEYRMSMDMLVNQARVLALLDLDTMGRTVEHADAIGFLFVAAMDYSAKSRSLDKQRALIDAAKKLVEALKA